MTDMTAEQIRALPLPPGFRGLPWIGMPPLVLSKRYLQRQYKKHGGVFKTRVLGRNVAIFVGPEANRFVLQTGSDNFVWRDGWPPNFIELLGESLFVQDGDNHRRKRRLIMPAFHRESLHNYLTIMEDITQDYLARLTRLSEFRFLDQNKEFTFDLAATLLMGSDPGDERERLSQLFVTLTEGFLTLPIRKPWAPYGKALDARKELLAFIDQAIEKRRKNPTSDALGLLVQTRDEDGNALTNDELQSQTLLLLFAGHETSASLLTSLMMMLPQYPEVWQKLRDEQSTLNIDGRLTMENIKQMTYLEQALKEAERMFPPVPAGFRGVVKDCTFNGYRIPKGWTALYMINGGAHYDPDIFPDPTVFDPDRFSPERNESGVPFSLVGFGGGSRICVGFAFAQLEMKVLLSYMLRKYTWDIVKKQNLGTYYFPTLMPPDGLIVRFRSMT
ncbi:MAG: cytochrome P450 [Chloroflexota bacterium]